MNIQDSIALKEKIVETITNLDKPKFSGGTLSELQEMIQSLAKKLEEIESRLEKLE